MLVSESASRVNSAPFKSYAPTPPIFVSVTSVPFEYKIFVPLSDAPQVTPV
jgi:hypothetical protein